MLSINAAVEQSLDAQAQRQPIDLDTMIARLRDRLEAAGESNGATMIAVDTAAHLAHGAASLARLVGPDPDAWARAAQLWQQLPDPWATATARLREAEAAASSGAAARAAAALQEAQRIASELDAAPLLAEIAGGLTPYSTERRGAGAEGARHDVDRPTRSHAP